MHLCVELSSGSTEIVDPEGSMLVLATQDCDLVKDNDKLPFVEALMCDEKPEAVVAGIMANDARYFVLDRKARLVADRNHVVLIRKDALSTLGDAPAPPCGGNVQLASRFARWLGARYDRPAFPNELVRTLVAPLSQAFKKLVGPGKKYAWLNDDLREVRLIPKDLSNGPPYEVTLIFLLGHDADVEAAKGAIAEVIERTGIPIRDVAEPRKLETASTHLVKYVVVSESRLALLEYWASTPVSLEIYTYGGDEIAGAEPLRADPT
jgi:hypothetical protein